MYFNLDDPLAGILSDGSDDSFFDDDILGKKKTQTKKSTPISDKKKALFDLGSEITKSQIEPKLSSSEQDVKFGQRYDTVKNTDNVVRLVPSDKNVTSSPLPFKRTLSKESVKVASNEIGIDMPLKSPAKAKPVVRTESKKEPPKSIERGKSSQSLLDDILGGPSSRPGTSQPQTKPTARPTTATKTADFDFDSILEKNQKIQTTKAANVEKQKQAQKDIVPIKKTKSSDDWLGLFQDKNAAGDADEDSGMPSWLVGAETKTKGDNENKTKSKLESKSKTEVESKREDYTEKDTEKEIQKLPKTFEPAIPNLAGLSDNITAEGAALYLQQQEAQLMVALQLKAQDEKLAAMQIRQEESARVHREATKASREHVEALLRRQAEQRSQMQAVIAAHQDRISERIRSMLGPSKIDVQADGDNENALQPSSGDTKETPHSKEKKQLLQLVQSLQENHDKEIDLMETSYRRQLAFLEISLNQAEERMKEESDKAVKFYIERITWLEEHHNRYKMLVEQNMTALTDRNRMENEMLRQQHLENSRILQEHHAALMENVKNAVKQEQMVVKDAAGFSANLIELVADVKENKAYCQQLADKVQVIAETSLRDGERNMHARHSQLNDLMEHLKKERDNFETEKSEQRELAKLLESRLKQMTLLIEEESAALKQKRMEFEFEKATFSKQTEFAKNVLKKQDEEVKMLKEEIQKEYQDKISRIEEEKAKAIRDGSAVAKEKSAVQSLRQELEKMKSELQMQLEEVLEDRSKLNIEKQQIQMEEQRVLAKSRDLDLLAKAAMEKQSQADTKYAESESIQGKYEERIRRIQEHVVSLNNREKQIAREKVTLSRERLSLHNEKKQIEGLQQCSLCKSQSVPQYSYEAAYSMHDNLNGPVSRDYGAPYVSPAVNAFETEMAHLLGRNLGLRNSVLNSNAISEPANENIESREPIESMDNMKEYMDPKLMMLRLDVQQVLNNLEHSRKKHNEEIPQSPDEINE